MCSLASQTCRRTGLLNCCHGIGTIRTRRWSLELGIMLYAIRGPRRVLSILTTPAGIKTGVSRYVWADDESSLTHRLCAGSDIGRRNRTVTERADERGWQARKQSP